MPTTPLDHLGVAPLFLGDETQHWTLPHFERATAVALSYGFTSMIIRVADGNTFWYGGTEGKWQAVLATVRAAGMVAIPCVYSHGRRKYPSTGKRYSLEQECQILAMLMSEYGIVIAEMRGEYNGKPEWGADVCRIMRDVPGVLGVTTWGFPSWQKWDGVLRAITPCVDFYLPQVGIRAICNNGLGFFKKS